MNNIKLTLPKATVLKDGQFFSQVTEATNRGCILSWNSDFTAAVQILDTDVFFSEATALDIVKSGGEVENYPFTINLLKKDFLSPIPDVLFNYLNRPNSESISTIGSIPSYKETFNFVEKVYADNAYEDGKVPGEDDYISVKILTSVNSEYLPISIVNAMLTSG